MTRATCEMPAPVTVDHGDRWTVFLPNEAGVDVWRAGLRCERHELATGDLSVCHHVEAVREHGE